MKRIIVVTVAVLMLVMSLNLLVYADEGETTGQVTYGIEYKENEATVTLYLSEVSAFDLAIAYDPDKLTVSKAVYSNDFKKLNTDDSNSYTTISVLNKTAKDKQGNTYVVFTGAGLDQKSGGSIPFAGKPFATVTFQGNIAESEIRLVTDSALVKDITLANPVDMVSLNQQPGTIVTPAPLKDSTAAYSSESPEAIVSSTAAASDSTAKATDEAAKATEKPSEDATKADTDKNNNEKTNKSTGLYIIIAAAAVIIVVGAVLIIRKFKRKD